MTSKHYFLSRGDVVDNLTSTDTGKPLSANQGNVLNAKPTILSGTSDPAASQGRDGDIYIKYTA